MAKKEKRKPELLPHFSCQRQRKKDRVLCRIGGENQDMPIQGSLPRLAGYLLFRLKCAIVFLTYTLHQIYTNRCRKMCGGETIAYFTD